jgi:hypothetical protein
MTDLEVPVERRRPLLAGLPAGLPDPDPHPSVRPGQRCAQTPWLLTTHALRDLVDGQEPGPKGGRRVGVRVLGCQGEGWG